MKIIIGTANKSQVKKIDDGCKNYKEAYNSKYSKFLYLGNWIEKESNIFKNETLKKMAISQISKGAK